MTIFVQSVSFLFDILRKVSLNETINCLSAIITGLHVTGRRNLITVFNNKIENKEKDGLSESKIHSATVRA